MTTTLLQRVDPSRLRSLVPTAVIVGLFAGLVAAGFAFVAGEPSIDAAIAIEEANAAADPSRPASAPLEEAAAAEVSRSDQRGVGLFGAYALTGAAFGALLALTAHGLRRGRSDAARRVLLAGIILGGAFTVAPWFKYPPNPPAVGDPATLGRRQLLYLAMICIAAVVGLGATILSRRLRVAGWADHRRIVAIATSVAVVMLVVFAVLPPAPDPVLVPATLVWRFRVASLGANLTLWTVLTLGVGWVVAEAGRRTDTEVADHRPAASLA
jgi:predicted cobalt transporter CbtA